METLMLCFIFLGSLSFFLWRVLPISKFQTRLFLVSGIALFVALVLAFLEPHLLFITLLSAVLLSMAIRMYQVSCRSAEESAECEESVGEKEAEIIALYEYLRTRALDKEEVDASLKTEPFPLWVNLWELHSVLSMHHNGDFMVFLRQMENTGHDSYTCAADDHKLPPFPDRSKLKL